MPDFNLNDMFPPSGGSWQTTQNGFGQDADYSTSWEPGQDGAIPEGYQWYVNPANAVSDTPEQRYLARPQDFEDGLFGMLINAGVAGVTGGLGGGFGGGLGLTGTAASAANGALTGGIIGGGNGANPFTSALQGGAMGALGGATSSFNPAAQLGIENPTGQTFLNSALKNTATGLAKGNDLQSSLTNGTLGATVPTANSFFGDLWNTHFNDGGLDSLQGSGGDMSGQTDVTPNSYDEGNVLSSQYTGNRYETPLMGFTQQESAPQQFRQSSFNVPDAVSQLGGFASRNAGDLASMIYGVYNNRRQQQMLNNQRSSLEGLFSQDSPYAQQLRAKLGAGAAAKGQRFNTAGRETQLQAALADRYASLQPEMSKINQSQFGLQNNLMNMGLQGFQKLGGFQGLQSMFGGGDKNAYQQYYGSNA